MSLTLARSAIRAARTHLADASTRENRALLRALSAQLEAVERAVTDAIYAASQRAKALTEKSREE